MRKSETQLAGRNGLAVKFIESEMFYILLLSAFSHDSWNFDRKYLQAMYSIRMEYAHIDVFKNKCIKKNEK